VTPTPDPDWQAGCLLLLALWLVYALVRGWVNGPLRLLVKPAALLLSWVLVHTFGGTITGILAKWTGWSVPVCVLAGSAALGVVGYEIFYRLGRTFFKRTREHAEPLTRITFGLTGALLSSAFSLFWIWVTVVLIRFAGHLASEQSASDLGQGLTPDAWTTNALRLQASAESVFGKRLVDACDPVPRWVYQRIDRIIRLAASPVALQRLATYPGFQSAWDDPRVRALAADPTVAQELRRGAYWEVLANPKVWDLLNSPGWWRIFSGPEFDAALRYALDGT
jgi:hypothetical protein